MIILAICITAPALMLNAQESSTSTVTNQIWLDFNAGWKFSKQFELRGKIGAKTIFPNEWNKFYTTAEISYWIPKFRFKNAQYDERVYFGIDFYEVYFNEGPNVIEISPYQGYTQTWPKLKRFTMLNNFELGERFQWDVEEWNYSFGLKLSYEASMIFNFRGDVWKPGDGFF